MTTTTCHITGAALRAREQNLPGLLRENVASRIFAKDATLWGSEAEAEAAVRLGWVDAPTVSRPLVRDILELREALRSEGISRIVLCGMGGSSLAPEVMAATAGAELTVLDSTDPEQVTAVLAVRLDETAIVVSSKSGSTLETDLQRRVFEHAFTEAGLDARNRIIVVTDPGSPLEKFAREAGYRAVFNADPTVGGRYSALTAFGLVPAGLAGVDIEAFLDEAKLASTNLIEDSADNLGLVLGAVLGGTHPLRNKIVLIENDSGMRGFADWAEQLIAESTGKSGTGLLPVVAGPRPPESVLDAPDVLVVRLATAGAKTSLGDNEVFIAGGLAAQMMIWEFATVVAGRLLGINPFDQPDVEAAKLATRSLLDAGKVPTPPYFTEGSIEVRGGDFVMGFSNVSEAVGALLNELSPDGYLSVQAYLDRHADAELEVLRPVLAAVTGRPVTFGWGPRFLHSTGQFHKGGPANGIFLQLTTTSENDLPIPGRSSTFGEVIAAQAAGDAQVLSDLGRPVLRLHFTDRAAGVGQLYDLVMALAGRTTSATSI